jgi:hypothetical protein
MVYGECEIYGKRFVFPKFRKNGYVEVYKEVNLNIDRSEEEC